ncbi:T9SS type A sorting domain-containing protein [Bernardetia sp.]|uniref:T9SS type A sorting domain-containing protein n=1 Tax=Bernardetia sp. TaxID=1937974 RepID=UPI0025C61BBE|nr:T9SS type A sorting domain-containing protein [Bernardetia sp.]
MNILKSAFVFVFAITLSFTNSFASPADEDDMIAIVEALPNSNKFLLKFENEKEEKVKIKIYNSDLQLVHSEALGKKAQIQRLYDMSALGEGTYTVVLEGETYKEKRTVTLVNPLENNFIATFSPKATHKKVFASVENNKGTVKLTLTDINGNILYEESIVDEKKERTLNLENLERGTYFLQIIGKNKTEYETYYID